MLQSPPLWCEGNKAFVLELSAWNAAEVLTIVDIWMLVFAKSHQKWVGPYPYHSDVMQCCLADGMIRAHP